MTKRGQNSMTIDISIKQDLMNFIESGFGKRFIIA